MTQTFDNPDPKLPSEPQQVLPSDRSALDVVYVLAVHARQLVWLPPLIAALTVAGSFLLTPVYTASLTLMPPSQQQSAATALLGQLGGMAAGVGSAVAGLKNPTDQWLGLLKSRTVADAMVDEFKLIERYKTDYRFEARDKLADNTTITAGKDGLILITVDDESPEIAAAMANAYAAKIQKMSDTIAVTEPAQRRVFFEREMAQAADKLSKAERALQESGVNVNALKVQPDAVMEFVAKLKAEISALQVRMAVMRQSLADSSPEMRQARAELSSLQQQLDRANQRESSGRDQTGYVEKYREFKYYETLYELLAKQYELARVDEAQNGVFQVVDKAQVPEKKSRPKRILLGLGAWFLSLVFLSARALMLDSVRRLKRDPESAKKIDRIRHPFRSTEA